jgi:MerR family copper efflux transcriptional regulator
MSKPHRHLAILPPESLRRSEGEVRGVDKQAESVVLQVGELAKQTGKTVRAIHLYEDMGLLRPVNRSRGRYRLYNHESVERVRWISKLQALGFSLPDMKQLMESQVMAGTGKQGAMVLRGAFVEKLAEVQGKLTELHRLEQELLSSLTYLDACQTACVDEVHRESCPECERHADQPSAPALVAGALAN